MKYGRIILGIVAACLLGGCGKGKPTADHLVGTWHDLGESAYESTLTFNKDHTLASEVQLRNDAGPVHLSLTGMWTFGEGKLTYTIDKASGEAERFAGPVTVTVTAVDDNSFTALDANGRTRVFSRVVEVK